MADRLEMHVLAVGQGSCGLVCHYNMFNKLVQLDLCDCGRTGGRIPADTLKDQMRKIRSLMQKRAAAAGVTGLYLDNVIISHKDKDHLNLFTDRYLFEGCTPSPDAEKSLGEGLKRKRRGISPAMLPSPMIPPPAANGGRDEKKNGLFLFETDYIPGNEVKSLSVEYEWENDEEDPVPESDFTYSYSYSQRYKYSEELENFVPTVNRSFSYKTNPADNNMPRLNGLVCGFFSLGLDACPDTGYTEWSVACNVEIFRDEIEDVEWGIIFSLTQQEDAKVPVVVLDLKLATDSIGSGEDLQYELDPHGQSMAFCWEPAFLDSLDQFTRACFQELCQSQFSKLESELSLEIRQLLCQCMDMILPIYNGAFEQMSKRLRPMFPVFSLINIDMIRRCLFDGPAKAPNSQPLSVGKIYLGGLETSKSVIAKNAVAKLSTFCPEDVQLVSGIASGGDDIRLIQMPLKWMKEQEENSRSIMYMARDKKGYRSIFTGDATGDTMSFYLVDIIPQLDEEGVTLSNTWLCAPHHGSWETCRSRSSENPSEVLDDYLDQLSPACILISAGFTNQFSHPRAEFLASAVGSLEGTPPVKSHCLMFCSPEVNGWNMLSTQRAVYSTVSGNDDASGMCYVNLSVQANAQVTIGTPLAWEVLKKGSVAVCQDGGIPIPQAVGPRCENMFSFLFDEPFLTEMSAL